MSGKRIARAVATLAVAAGLAAGLNAAPANATAACSTVGAPYGVIGSYVRTTSGTYARSSCVKLNGVYRSGNAVTVTGGIRDTATDGKLAGVWVAFKINGTWGAWQWLANTGYEGGFASFTQSYRLNGTPSDVAFVALRYGGGVTDAFGDVLSLHW